MYTVVMSKETERIINRSNAEHLHRLKMKELGGKIVKKRADELLRDFDFTDKRESKHEAKRFLEFLIPQITLKNTVDSEEYTTPYILSPNSDEVFLVIERNIATGNIDEHNIDESIKIIYKYIETMALGCKRYGEEIVVGFFKNHDKDPYLSHHPDEADFVPLDTGMLFFKTVTEKEIVPTLALAIASYEYNKGKDLNDQITFPSEI